MAKNMLDVDSSILENKLRIQAIDSAEKEFNSLFGNFNKSEKEDVENKLNNLFPEKRSGVDDGIPWKLVTPTPGLCVKFFTRDGEKSFVNVCQTKEIPAPKDVTEDEILKILDSDDTSSFRIPMSISDPHLEPDKSGNPVNVYDVAVHSSLISKIDKRNIFKAFFMTAMLEALQEKYKISVNSTLETPYIILKNRKSLGPLRPHRIQQRDIRPPPGPLVQEVKTVEGPQDTPKPANDSKVKLELYPSEGEPQLLQAKIKIRNLRENDVNVEVGEDRLVLTAVKKNVAFVDICLPCNVDQDKTSAEYSRSQQELLIKMPVLKKS